MNSKNAEQGPQTEQQSKLQENQDVVVCLQLLPTALAEVCRRLLPTLFMQEFRWFAYMRN